jgi:hypothetical protein
MVFKHAFRAWGIVCSSPVARAAGRHSKLKEMNMQIFRTTFQAIYLMAFVTIAFAGPSAYAVYAIC